MKTRLCEVFRIEYPIFAFTHCRDVVAAVSRAGGLGVLGAVGYSAEQLEIELSWIDAHVDGKPYGVDFIMPASSADMPTGDPQQMYAQARAMIPERHRRFVDELIKRFDLPDLPPGEPEYGGVLGWTPEVYRQQVEVAFAHPIKLIANALGSPPADVIERAHREGVQVAALAGKVDHAERHVANGVDIVIAQGTEAGGHTGDIATMVLVPEVVDAVAGKAQVLAAGGIARGRQIAAALALGADGVWTGSVWLTTAESDATPEVMNSYLHATSSDTVRTRSFSGKPARMLRTPWTQAWEAEDSPGTLPMPLQNILIAPAMSRFFHAHKAHLMFAPVGQVVGQLRQVRRVRDVIHEMVEEYVATVGRLDEGLAGGTDTQS
ncbi:MAG: 2-nitropropane dioxygenase [Deltaproteobacteria bacterium]|jgi:NAD(P)H-dependent flavin oxidoreductase YrpB (nitropropane dioxygenase family)|nr:2-nitropropane dioxygenase [Deltaproteobacteria bacterium]